MTFDQGLVLAVVIAMMGLFAWGRWRYDLVAVLALLSLWRSASCRPIKPSKASATTS